MRRLLTIFLFGILTIMLSGCFAGFSRLPEINFIGKSKEEVVKIFVSNPEKVTGGTHVNICTPLPNGHCVNNLYFKTVEETLADQRVQQASVLSGYFTKRLLSTPTARDYYEVTFDQNGKVVSQRTYYIQDAM